MFDSEVLDSEVLDSECESEFADSEVAESKDVKLLVSSLVDESVSSIILTIFEL